MRRIVIRLGTPTNRRQYEEMTDKIQLHYRERIYPVLKSEDDDVEDYLEFADWDEWVQYQRGAQSFLFWIGCHWSTTSKADTVLDAELTQHLELSILPLVYWDDVPIQIHSHDCEGWDNCGFCAQHDWDMYDITTREANDRLAAFSD